MIRLGIRHELEWHVGNFSLVRRLRSAHRQFPSSKLVAMAIVDLRPCCAFPSFACLWVRSTAEYSVIAEACPSPDYVNPAAISAPGSCVSNGSNVATVAHEVVHTIDFDSLHFIALTDAGIAELCASAQPSKTVMQQDDEERVTALVNKFDVDNDALMRHGHTTNFVIQSVMIRNEPLSQQSYTYYMLQFAFSLYLLLNSKWLPPGDPSASGGAQRKLAELAVPWLHFPESPVLILGMGCNVIGRALDVLFGEGAPIHVLEIEPTVVELCREQGALASSRPGGFQCHVGDVRTSLGSMPRNCSLIFLDCYDPLASSMMHAQELIASCRDHLRDDGGVLVVNAHMKATEDSLLPFSKAFPHPGAVHVVYAEQSFVVCWHNLCATAAESAIEPCAEFELIRRLRLVLAHVKKIGGQKAEVLDENVFLPVRKLPVAGGGTVQIWDVLEPR